MYAEAFAIGNQERQYTEETDLNLRSEINSRTSSLWCRIVVISLIFTFFIMDTNAVTVSLP